MENDLRGSTTPVLDQPFTDTANNYTWTGHAAGATRAPWVALSPPTLTFRIVLLAVICVLGVATNSLNGMMLLKSKRPGTTMHLLMLNLVVVDLTMSLTCIPVSIFFSASNGSVQVPDQLCKAAACVLQTLIIASLLTQSAISVIRTVAITFPEALQQRLPPSAACKIIAYIWLQSCLTPLLPLLNHDNTQHDLFTYRPIYIAYVISDGHTSVPSAVIFSILGHLLPLSVICISYIILYVSLRRHLKKNFLVQDRCSRHMYTVQMRVQVRVGCLVIFVVSSTAFIWTPFYIMTCMSLFELSEFEYLSRNASAVLMFAASSINPVMYGFMNTSLRQEFKAYLTAKHPKVLELVRRMRCCRWCRKRKTQLDAVIVIPREQIQKSTGEGCGKNARGGNASGQLVLQINHEISLKKQSVFSVRHSIDPGETNATTKRQQREAAPGARGAVPPLLKRCSWSQSLAHNARRFSDKVSRRRSGSDGNSTSDGRKQLPLLDITAISQLREESQGQHIPNICTPLPDERITDSHKSLTKQADDCKTKYHTLSRNQPSPQTKSISSGHKDGSIVAVSKCFKKKPVFGDIVKVRRVFIEEVTLLPDIHGPVSEDTLSTAGIPRPQSPHRESICSEDSLPLNKAAVKTGGDVYTASTPIQLPGCIQGISDK